MKINSTAGCESNELGRLTTSAFSQQQAYSFPIIGGSSPNVFTFKPPAERLVVSVFCGRGWRYTRPGLFYQGGEHE